MGTVRVTYIPWLSLHADITWTAQHGWQNQSAHDTDKLTVSFAYDLTCRSTVIVVLVVYVPSVFSFSVITAKMLSAVCTPLNALLLRLPGMRMTSVMKGEGPVAVSNWKSASGIGWGTGGGGLGGGGLESR